MLPNSERRKLKKNLEFLKELPIKKLRRDWSNAEIGALSKAMAKYPGGVSQRWKHICDYINIRCKADFSEEEVIAQNNKFRKESAEKAYGSSHTKEILQDPDVWNVAQQQSLENALRTIKESDPKKRWELIGASVKGKSARECLKRCKMLQRQAKQLQEAKKNK